MSAARHDDDGQAGQWRRSLPPDEGLRRVVETVRERIVLILVTVALTTAAAVAYVVTASPSYSARAELLITPVPSGDTALVGLGLIHESSDPTRDVQTAARLVTTPEVAARVKAKLGSDRSSRSLLKHVTAEPVAQSNIVAVSADASKARSAQQLANGFAEAAVDERSDRLHAQLRNILPHLRARVQSLPPSARTGADSATSQLAELETLLQTDDPTIRVETRGQRPDSPSSPRRVLSIAAGLVAGLVLGLGGAFAVQLLDPRLRRDEQLQAGYRIPVLARIPTERKRRRRVLRPEQLSLATTEAYRALRAALVTTKSAHPRSILVTGPATLEGKTTTALNLASSLAELGQEVILVEADLRRPSLGTALEVSARGRANPNRARGIEAVLNGQVRASRALVVDESLGPHLRFLLSERSAPHGEELFAKSETATTLTELKQLADWVIIDAPPVNLVADTLPLAGLVDEVILVVRMGKTRLRELSGVSERIAQLGVEPAGFVVVGSDEFPRGYGYY